jgi:carbon storage regulator
MLVLSRKINEEIIIDGRIRIIVNDIAGDKVRLAIEAPGLSIDRREIWEAKQKLKQQDQSPGSGS